VKTVSFVTAKVEPNFILWSKRQYQDGYFKWL